MAGAAVAALVSTSLSAQIETAPALATQVQVAAPAMLSLNTGTPITLAMAEEVNSSTHREGDIFRSTVLTDRTHRSRSDRPPAWETGSLSTIIELDGKYQRYLDEIFEGDICRLAELSDLDLRDWLDPNYQELRGKPIGAAIESSSVCHAGRL